MFCSRCSRIRRVMSTLVLGSYPSMSPSTTQPCRPRMRASHTIFMSVALLVVGATLHRGVVSSGGTELTFPLRGCPSFFRFHHLLVLLDLVPVIVSHRCSPVSVRWPKHAEPSAVRAARRAWCSPTSYPALRQRQSSRRRSGRELGRRCRRDGRHRAGWRAAAAVALPAASPGLPLALPRS